MMGVDSENKLSDLDNVIELASRSRDPISSGTIEKIDQLIRCIDSPDDQRDRLSVLRSCNELLCKLEGSMHNQFAGRVLIFLAKIIPFFDQSGVNLRSEFNAKELPTLVNENLQTITKFTAAEQDVTQDMEEGETISDDDESDDSTQQDDPKRIYEKFWKAQQFFCQPNQLYDRNNWLSFRTIIDILLLQFETKPATFSVWKLNDSFMTDPKAFALQINDINMRRCFLIQVLIILQYLHQPVETRPDSLTLDRVQSNWLDQASQRAVDLLDNLPNQIEGREFLGFISQVLRTENAWNKWKNEKCKEPKKPEDEEDIINMGVTYHKRRKLSDDLRSAKPYNMHVIGSHEMTRLWNERPNQMRYMNTDLHKYYNLAPEKQIEKFKDPNTSFRILRLLRKSPYFFVPTAAVIQSIDGYLKSLADKFKSELVTNNQSKDK